MYITVTGRMNFVVVVGRCGNGTDHKIEAKYNEERMLEEHFYLWFLYVILLLVVFLKYFLDVSIFVCALLFTGLLFPDGRNMPKRTTTVKKKHTVD